MLHPFGAVDSQKFARIEIGETVNEKPERSLLVEIRHHRVIADVQVQDENLIRVAANRRTTNECKCSIILSTLIAGDLKLTLSHNAE